LNKISRRLVFLAALILTPAALIARQLKAVWRPTDAGASWVRINHDEHQWGLRFRMLVGDPREFGRVYVATDGRGILYGDPLH
jgi:photosystem II stability/assembly factor-like uncharacterized protein